MVNPCICGHVLDEHRWNSECEIDGCSCLGYEEDEEFE